MTFNKDIRKSKKVLFFDTKLIKIDCSKTEISTFEYIKGPNVTLLNFQSISPILDLFEKQQKQNMCLLSRSTSPENMCTNLRQFKENKYSCRSVILCDRKHGI